MFRNHGLFGKAILIPDLHALTFGTGRWRTSLKFTNLFLLVSMWLAWSALGLIECIFMDQSRCYCTLISPSRFYRDQLRCITWISVTMPLSHSPWPLNIRTTGLHQQGHPCRMPGASTRHSVGFTILCVRNFFRRGWIPSRGGNYTKKSSELRHSVPGMSCSSRTGKTVSRPV